MLARLQKDCEKHVKGMQRARGGNDEGENITVDILTRSQLQSELTTE